MGSRGHVPQRRCAGCGRRSAKKSLVRFAAGGDGEKKIIVIDPGGTAGGRGVYLCPRLKCYDEAAGRRKALQRRLGSAGLEAGLRTEFARLAGCGDNRSQDARTLPGTAPADSNHSHR
ncbi:MAG: YlxR family protein [Thermoleophilia bacterium]|nr:YlxR family protein [Thermoleophilia bacterium]